MKLLTKENKFIGLLIGQLTLIFTMPVLHYFSEDTGKYILHAAFIGMILISIVGNHKHNIWYRSIVILTAIEAIIFIFATQSDHLWLTYTAISLSLFFLVISIGVAFKSVFLQRYYYHQSASGGFLHLSVIGNDRRHFVFKSFLYIS